MRAVVVGATGTIGSAVADALAAKGHEVLRASRKGQVAVDLTDPASIRRMYEQVGRVDAVVSCAGMARMGALTALTDEDWSASIADKLMGAVHLVRFGTEQVADRGAFVLTAGIWSQKPPAGATAVATMNGAIESFTRAASRELPRGIRIVAISPPWIDESAQRMGQRGALSAADNARAYVAAVEAGTTGTVVYPS